MEVKNRPDHSSVNRWVLPWIVAIAMFMESLDSTIVGVAIPSIAKNFSINPVNLKLALTSYLLSLAIFIPISGWVADRVGAKKVFFWAILLFTISSLLCALSPNIEWLVLARFMQGMGAAMMMPVGRLLILQRFSKAEFAQAMQIVIVPGLVGPSLGPTIGGIILHFASWHWIFLVNIPIGLLGLYVIHRYIAFTAGDKTLLPFDKIGFFLFGFGLSAITLSLAILGEDFDKIAISVACLLGAFLCFFLYYVHHKRTTSSLINWDLLKSKSYFASLMSSFIIRLSVGAIPFLLPLLLQMVWGVTPLVSGLLFVPLGLGMMSAKFLMIRNWLQQYGFKRVLIINSLFVGLSLVSISFFARPNSLILLSIILFLYGVFTSQQFTSLGTLSIIELEPEQFSQATSLSSTVQQFSIGCGVALAAILLHFFAKLHQEAIFTPFVFHWTMLSLSITSLLVLPFLSKLDRQLKLPQK